jgi:hypothetical protein
VAPLRLGGLRGKKSTPSVWLGGTGELIEVGKQEQERQEQGIVLRQAENKASLRYVPELSRVECIFWCVRVLLMVIILVQFVPEKGARAFRFIILL